jgi:hypothetical protein
MYPEICIASVRKIFDDGGHNAFTDLVAFQGKLYLTFRTCPDGHDLFLTSRIIVLRSDDYAASWKQVHTFSIPDRDVRDPHFLVYADRLFVYSGTWLVEEPRDTNHHLGYCVWSDDGDEWNGPRFLEGTFGHYVWRAAARGSKAYLCGRRRRGFAWTGDTGDGVEATQSVMLESEDGFVWRTAGFFMLDHGGETAFVFDDRGGVLSVVRTGGGLPSQVCRSEPPYREWSRTMLPRTIGGPMLARWGERYLVSGRKVEEGPIGLTAVGWLGGLGAGETPHLVEGPVLPSGGDTSYPGFHALSDTEGLLSYYSSHEGTGATSACGGNIDASIYLAHLTIE